MKAEEWMGRAWKTNDEIAALIIERQKAFDAAISITTNNSTDKVNTTNKNTSEAKFVKYIKYSIMIDEKIDMLYQIKSEIFSLIVKIENSTYRTLLVLRYIHCKSWKDVADEMNYSTRQCSRIHEAAMVQIQTILDKKSKKV